MGTFNDDYKYETLDDIYNTLERMRTATGSSLLPDLISKQSDLAADTAIFSDKLIEIMNDLLENPKFLFNVYGEKEVGDLTKCLEHLRASAEQFEMAQNCFKSFCRSFVDC